MAIGTESVASFSKRIAGKTETGIHLNWDERVVTVVAASIAVLIVATIAVLMGMA